MATLVLSLSLGLVEGCRHHDTVSGSGTTGTAAGALTKQDPVRPDWWEPGPARAWKECKTFRSPEHIGTNGPKLAGFEFFRGQWISKEGASIEGVRVQQGALVGEILSSGGEKTLLQGDAWRGVQLRGRIPCPARSMLKLDVQARISDVIPEGDGSAGDARRYKLEILWPPVGTSVQSWTSEHTSGYAVALEGVWDDTTGEHRSSVEMLTLARDDTAVGKCYQSFRYRPWDTGESASPKPMSELHAACVRMVRADYCGNGTSATANNTSVDVWDTANVNKPDSPGLGFEAAWTSKGAVCLDHPRVPELWKQCTSALPICHSPEEAKALAKQKRLGEVLLFNASCKNQPCPGAPVEARP